MLLSPEVRNAIHVGDRILEINGLPVGTMMEAEVGLCLTVPVMFKSALHPWMELFEVNFIRLGLLLG